MTEMTNIAAIEANLLIKLIERERDCVCVCVYVCVSIYLCLWLIMWLIDWLIVWLVLLDCSC